MKRLYVDITDICIPSDDNNYDELVEFADAIAEQETIEDVAPVRHGRWELYSDGCSKYVSGCSKECTGCRDNNDCLAMNKRCSICKRPTPWIVSECSVCGGVGADAHGGHLEYTFKQYEPMYCPNCGAKMDEEEKEQWTE